jgi:hypothetical protein
MEWAKPLTSNVFDSLENVMYMSTDNPITLVGRGRAGG